MDEFDNKIKIGNIEVHLDEEKLRFNEANLTKYFENEALYYDFFGRQLANAEYLLQRKEIQYDKTYAKKFKDYKDIGGSDNLCASKALADQDVVDAKVEVVLAKRKVKLIQQHLRAWDKAHENALNLGYTLRKEMSKLVTIKGPDSELDRIMGNE
jgi:hypothetical protein